MWKLVPAALVVECWHQKEPVVPADSQLHLKPQRWRFHHFVDLMQHKDVKDIKYVSKNQSSNISIV